MSAATLPQGAFDRRYTDAEFEAMVGAGIIRDGSRTFLWDGRIVEPMAEGKEHREVYANVRDLLIKALPDEEWAIYTAPTILLRPNFRPQPDIVVARGPRSAFKDRLLVPRDIALIVEIAHTTLRHDAGDYLAEYAHAGIPQYWIAAVGPRTIQRYLTPDVEAGRYVLDAFDSGQIPFDRHAFDVAAVFRNV